MSTGTKVYAALVQSPPGSFAGALSLGFCPEQVLAQAEVLLHLVTQGFQIRRDHLAGRLETRRGLLQGGEVLADVDTGDERFDCASACAM